MGNRYLGLAGGNSVPDGYDEYIWISDRCVEGMEYCKNIGKKTEILENPLQLEDDIKTAIRYLKKIKKELITYLTAELNAYHHVQYSEKQWNILLTFWLTSFISSLYEKHLRLTEIEKKYPRCEVELYKAVEIIPPLDYYEYWNKTVTSEKYNIFLYQQIIESRSTKYHLLDNYTLQYELVSLESRPKKIGLYKVKTYEFLQSILKSIRRQQELVIFNNSYLPNSFLAELWQESHGEIAPYITKYAGNTRDKITYDHIDSSWRNQKISIINIEDELEDEFKDICFSLVRKNLPIVYLEGFKSVGKLADGQYRYAQNANAIFFAGGAAIDEIFKHYLFQMAEKSILCGIQHGGNYGIDEMWLHEDEWGICDRFYTWGWKKNELQEKTYDCKFVPMPAAKLMQIEDNGVQKGEKILYVSYTEPRYYTSLWPREMNYKKDKDSEIRFLSKMSDKVKKQLIVRLYHRKLGWNVREDIDKAVDGICYDSEPDFYKSLNQAKLVVLFEWSTTVLEALYKNKPILVLRDDSFVLPEAENDIQMLKDVGIVCSDWDTLLQRLEKISIDIDSWWNGIDVQTAVSKVKEKYTFVPNDAKERWKKEIYNLANK